MASIKEVILPSGNAYELRDSITHVVLTQAQYDALVAAGTMDNDKVYFITDGDAPASSASDVTYSNIQSGLSATNVQDAVDELVRSDSRTLAGLTDTEITTPVVDQLIGYNGTKWINKTVNIPSKTSDLQNDSNYAPINDSNKSTTETWSSNKISDEIIAILPTGVESGVVANFKTSLALPLVDYTVDNTVTKVFQRGLNLWDEDWEVGTYNTNTGEKSSSTTRIRSKNLFPIPNAVGSKLYITQIGSGNGLSFLFYDKNKVFKNGYYRADTTGGFSFTIEADWCYMAISPNENYGTTYNNDISIRIDNNYSYVAYNTNSNEYAVADIGNIVTFSGWNNIFTDDGNISVTYKKSINDAIAELQALILS